MKVICNGREQEVAEGTATIGLLLANLKLDPDSVVVELNGRVLGREEMDGQELRDGDRLELVRFVGGG